MGGAKTKLIISDAGDSAEKAKNAAQRLVAQYPDVIGGVGAWLSTFALAVTEVTERAELPWLTLFYSDAITGRGFHYVFQTSATGGPKPTSPCPPSWISLQRRLERGRPRPGSSTTTPPRR